MSYTIVTRARAYKLVENATSEVLEERIHYLAGMERGGGGRIPGHFELVMHYRALRGYDKDDKKTANL